MAERREDFVEDARKTYIKTSYSLRGFVDKLVPSIFLCSYAIFLLIEWSSPAVKGTGPKPLSIYKLHLKELFQSGNHTPMIIIMSLMLVYLIHKLCMYKKNVTFGITAVLAGVIAFFAFKVNPILDPQYVRYSLISIASLSGLYAMYYIIYAKTSFIEVTTRALIIKTGVFSRTNDSTQLHQIKDCDTHKTFLERILGLERVQYMLKGQKDAFVIKYLTSEDAVRINEYINAISFDSSTEYWVTRDRIKNSSQNSRNARPGSRPYMDEGNDNQGDDDHEPEN